MRRRRPASGGMTDEQIVEALNELIELDRDTMSGYNSAVDGLDALPDIRRAFAGFRSDHERRVRELSHFVRQHGGTPRSAPDRTEAAASARAARTGAGGGAAIIRAATAEERRAARTYEEGLRRPWPAAIRDVVERGAADERRHLAYCEETQSRLGTRDR